MRGRGTELSQSDECFRLLVESVEDYAILLLDSKGHVVSWNAGAARIQGYRAEEIIGKHFFCFYDPKTLPSGKPEQALKVAAAEGRFEHEGWRVRKDGSRFWANVVITPLKDEAGHLRGFAEVSRDLTERKRAEEALRAVAKRYRDLFDRNLAGVFLCTTDGRILDCNKAFARIFGYASEEEVLAVTAWEFYFDPADREAFIARLQEERTLASYEACYRRKDGSPAWVLENVHLVEGEGGAAPLIEGTVVDITERKRIADQLRQSQKVEAIGQLAGGVAHDFNNLLTIITGYSQLLQERLEPDSSLLAHVEEILKAGNQAASLTRQLLAFGRRQVLQPRVLDLNAVVADVDKMLRRLIGEDIELLTVPNAALGRVKADPGQIEQVILNLAVNARDAMPRGGKLTIETANVELDEAYARTHVAVTPGPYVMLAVSDTGCGMDAETQAHIFEPFFTTKGQGKGTGLGLATVYGIVKQSGGNIWVYSEPGRGATFKIYLPRVEGTVETVEVRKECSAGTQGSETILLVEDDDSVRSLVRGVLQSSGYKVLEAAGGGQALLIGERYQKSIHLLLTDVVMPQMNGRALLEHLASSHPEMKVLYMSGYTDNAIVHHGVLDSGMTFLQKPFTPDTLVRKVREVLDTPRVK